MAKRYYKDLKILGKVFCLYNTRETGYFTLYTLAGQFYFKPRKIAVKGQIINGVANMVNCRSMLFGNKSGYQEIN